MTTCQGLSAEPADGYVPVEGFASRQQPVAGPPMALSR